MSNIHGLRDANDSDDEADHANDRFVGGIGDRGGGRCVGQASIVVGVVAPCHSHHDVPTWSHTLD